MEGRRLLLLPQVPTARLSARATGCNTPKSSPRGQKAKPEPDSGFLSPYSSHGPGHLWAAQARRVGKGPSRQEPQLPRCSPWVGDRPQACLPSWAQGALSLAPSPPSLPTTDAPVLWVGVSHPQESVLAPHFLVPRDLQAHKGEGGQAWATSALQGRGQVSWTTDVCLEAHRVLACRRLGRPEWPRARGIQPSCADTLAPMGATGTEVGAGTDGCRGGQATVRIPALAPTSEGRALDKLTSTSGLSGLLCQVRQGHEGHRKGGPGASVQSGVSAGEAVIHNCGVCSESKGKSQAQSPL